jgi:transposase-like protein
MQRKEFSRIIRRVSRLSQEQRSELAQILQGKSEPPQQSLVARVVNARVPKQSTCPRCQSNQVIRWGRKDELQRYRCRSCKRTFNSLTMTPLARLKHRWAWEGYAEALVAGLSVRKAGKKLRIHYTTAFRWRHRWLQRLRDLKDSHFNHIVEADETYFLHSMKGTRGWQETPPRDLPIPREPRRRGGKALRRGLSREQVPVLVVRDRAGATTDAVLPSVNFFSVAEVLEPLTRPGETILCSDGASVYRTFAEHAEIAHRPINVAAGERVIDNVFHIQNVNAYHSRLKNWMRRFCGVATKYLPNYLGWRRALDRHSEDIPPDRILAMAIG